MKHAFQIFKSFFKCPLAKIFLVANLIVCVFIFDWSEFLLYLSKINETGCKPKAVSFTLYDNYGAFGASGMIMEVVALILTAVYLLIFLIFLLLVGPSLAFAACGVEILKMIFPHWCPETFELLFIPLFAVFNSFYWVFLANLFEFSHAQHSQNKSPDKNPLSIYSK